MKRCPTCNRTYTDASLSFCIDDGTPLVPVAGTEEESTVVTPRSRGDQPASGGYSPRDWNGPAYQPPAGSFVPPGGARKRRVWPWVLGVLAVGLIGLVGLGIVGAILLPKVFRSNSNRGNVNANTNRGVENLNSNLGVNENTSNSNQLANANTNANANANANSSSTGPPTDNAQVLSTLTDIENEWTVANINADKKALERILADDYVATNLDGSRVGKVEYISTIQRDNQTQRWEFMDLKVDLKGNRATLHGVIKYYMRNGERAFQFSDTFVWRDGRWQATGSEIKEVPLTTL
ncbi:MAG TPA: DUF4440 domain-containing protein [Pyrinomonadaceae bacterium]